MNQFIPLKIRAVIAHLPQLPFLPPGTKHASVLPPLSRTDRRKSAQSFVEFALALPILLLLIFGTIEFGRLLQAWLALENGARFGVRYAVTGTFNPTYCGTVGANLYASDGTTLLSTLDAADGNVDCTITKDNDANNYQDDSNRLQDAARLPSIRDAALAGATGIAWDNAAGVSGDYLAYLAGAYTNGNISGGNRVTTQLGNPSIQGFFAITTCSNHVDPNTGDFFQLNANPSYYNGIAQKDYQYPVFCQQAQPPASNVVGYQDDAGGPGDRVHVILTYRHTLITPFLSSWWPTLLLTSEREGVVEKFRTSRVTGMTGDITYAATWTPIPSPTGAATYTDTPTITPTPTATNSPTPTVCPLSGTGLRGEYFFNQDLTGLVTTRLDPTVNFNWVSAPMAGMPSTTTNYSVLWIGSVEAPYTGTYTFTTTTDDGVRLWVNGSEIINEWVDQGTTSWANTINLSACTTYPIVMEYYQNTGGAVAQLSWTIPGYSSAIISQTYLYPGSIPTTPTVTPSSTSTASLTPTRTATGTATFTKTITPTRTITRTPTITFTPSKTFTPSATVPSKTPTNTPKPTNTPLPTNTPIPTNTFTPTFTPSKTPVPSNTPIPSATTVPTITKTPTMRPSPTACQTPIEMGGCR